MSSHPFYQIIDKTFIGKIIDRRIKVLETLNPDRIYVENVRQFYNIPFRAAQIWCDLAAKQRIFKKKIGIECVNCRRIIATINNFSELPETIHCDICEEHENVECDFKPTKENTIIYYQLNDKIKTKEPMVRNIRAMGGLSDMFWKNILSFVVVIFFIWDFIAYMNATTDFDLKKYKEAGAALLAGVLVIIVRHYFPTKDKKNKKEDSDEEK
jgi:hypothetical protein